MPVTFADRLSTPLSANRQISAKVLELRKQGIAVIDAGQGSPTYPTEREVLLAGIGDIAKMKTRYAPTRGDEEDRKKVAPYLNALLSARDPELNPKFTAEQISFEVGGSGAVTLSAQLVGQPGSTILISKPGYSNYPGPITGTGATLATYKTDRANGYIPTLEQLQDAVDPQKSGKTNVRAILFNYPGNPTGATLTRAKAETLGHTISQLVKDYPDLLIVNDLAYLGVSREGENYSIYPFLSDEAKFNTVNLFSSSKDISAANWRTGAVASINPKIIENLEKLCAGITMGINSVGTAGFGEAGALYEEFPNIQDGAIEHYQERLSIIADGLNDIAAKVTDGKHKVIDVVPGGGIFIYGDFTHLLGLKVTEEMREIIKHDTIESSLDIATLLVNMNKFGYAPVACIPGEGFIDDKENCSLRIAGIESPELLQQLVVSFAGLTQLLTGKDLGAKPNYEKVVEIIAREAKESTVLSDGVELLEEAAARARIKRDKATQSRA